MNTKILKTTAGTAAHRIYPKTSLSAVGLLAAGLLVPSLASAQLFDDVPGLSTVGRDALVTHFDARVGVSVDVDGGVTAWEGRDGDGNVVVTANGESNAGTPTTNIIRNGNNSALVFTESNVSHTRTLFANMVDGSNANLINGGSATIFWKGFYSSANPQDDGTLGRYAYNLSTAEFNVLRGGMNHQRRDATENIGTFVTAVNSTAGGGDRTILGDSISSRNDVSTVWTSIYEFTSPGGTVNFSANGADLNMGTIVGTQGTHTFDASNQPTLYIGGISRPASTSSSTGGFSFIGEMEQLIIFQGALSSSDISAVESYLSAIPEPGSAGLWIGIAAVAWTGLGRRRLAK